MTARAFKRRMVFVGYDEIIVDVPEGLEPTDEWLDRAEWLNHRRVVTDSTDHESWEEEG